MRWMTDCNLGGDGSGETNGGDAIGYGARGGGGLCRGDERHKRRWRRGRRGARWGGKGDGSVYEPRGEGGRVRGGVGAERETVSEGRAAARAAMAMAPTRCAVRAAAEGIAPCTSGGTAGEG